MVGKRVWTVMLCVCVLGIVGLLGCGGSDGPTGSSDKEVTGIVTKGPVDGASVSIYAMNTDGGRGPLVAGPVTTDADGAWSAVVRGDSGDDLLVISTGGSYTDEASGGLKTFGTGHQLIGYLNMRQTAPVAVLSPFTRALHGAAQRRIALFTEAAKAWADVTGEMEDALGFDALRTIPSAASGASSPQKFYAAFLGGLSTLMKEQADLIPLAAADFTGTALALADDLSDGRLDAKDIIGNPILVPNGQGGTTALPVLDENGVEPLAGYTADYADDHVDGLAGSQIPQNPVIFNRGCEDIPQLKTLAHNSLENTLYEVLNAPDPQSPDEVDLTEPRDLYQDVLDCAPDDLDANLALALLDLAALSMDAEVNAAFDEWDAYLDAFVPFETDQPGAGFSVEPRFPTGGGALTLPLALVRRSLLLQTLGATQSVPQISRTQDILEDLVLPKLESGIDHLTTLLDEMETSNPTFEFELTPKIQGDLYEESLYADRTDFLALRAALYGAVAGCYAALAYDVSMPEYDAATVVAALNRTSGNLGRLRTGGAAYMQAIPDLLISAADDLDLAITALLAEVDAGDNQDDEVIKIGPQDLNRGDVETFQSQDLPDIRASLSGPVSRYENWDLDDYTPDTELTLDLSAFFGNPVADWKTLAPPYTVTTETVPYEEDYHWSDSSENLTVQAPAAGSYSADCYRSYYDFAEDYGYESGPSWLAGPICDLVESTIADIAARSDWSGEASVSASYYGSLTAGQNQISVYLSINYSTVDRWVDVPIITFAADTYDEWLAQFPDPSIHGFFSGATDAGDVLATFGFTEENWAKELRLDWVDGVGFVIEWTPYEPPAED